MHWMKGNAVFIINMYYMKTLSNKFDSPMHTLLMNPFTVVYYWGYVCYTRPYLS